MSQDDVTQVKIGNFPIGIIGLKTVMEAMREEYAERPDREVEEELLRRLSLNNYIPDRARQDYEKTFLREFKKFLGKPHEKEASQGIDIKVRGPRGAGCTCC